MTTIYFEITSEITTTKTSPLQKKKINNVDVENYCRKVLIKIRKIGKRV